MRIKTMVLVLALFSPFAAACGGGSDTVSSPETASSAAATFAASAVSGDALCEQFDATAALAILGVAPGTIEVPLPADAEARCHISTWNPDTEVTNEVEFFVKILNTGGQAGYDAEVARWAGISDINQAVANVADTATYLEGGAGQRVLMLIGDDVVEVSSGPIYRDMFNAESANKIAALVAESF